ncbi:MAG: alpha/beta family hydrolase, partial [Pseudonocardiaceae bacterium]
MTALTIPTPHGPAQVELHCGEPGTAALLLGHGAGGSTSAPDLAVVTKTAAAAGMH